MATEKHKYPDLELDEDFELQKKDWRVKRIGWGIMLAIVVASLLGLLGAGPLSLRDAGSGDGLRVEYEKFMRYESVARLKLHVKTPRPAASVRIWIDKAYINEFQVEQITPEPERTESLPDKLIYSFALGNDSDSLDVICIMTTDHIGSLGASLGLMGGNSVHFSQFIYP